LKELGYVGRNGKPRRVDIRVKMDNVNIKDYYFNNDKWWGSDLTLD